MEIVVSSVVNLQTDITQKCSHAQRAENTSIGYSQANGIGGAMADGIQCRNA